MVMARLNKANETDIDAISGASPQLLNAMAGKTRICEHLQ